LKVTKIAKYSRLVQKIVSPAQLEANYYLTFFTQIAAMGSMFNITTHTSGCTSKMPTSVSMSSFSPMALKMYLRGRLLRADNVVLTCMLREVILRDIYPNARWTEDAESVDDESWQSILLTLPQTLSHIPSQGGSCLPLELKGATVRFVASSEGCHLSKKLLPASFQT
jgi:hypothetical protein